MLDALKSLLLLTLHFVEKKIMAYASRPSTTNKGVRHQIANRKDLRWDKKKTKPYKILKEQLRQGWTAPWFKWIECCCRSQSKEMLKVIVLSGFLGSGKTTLVKHILTNTQGKKVAVILNDISEFDIDVDMVKGGYLSVKKQKDIVQISNGCICCTLKEDMIKEVKKIYKSKKYQYLVIEATGVSTPLPIAQAFAYTPGINKFAEVYAMITVVDAENFEKHLISDELVEEEKQENGQKGKRGKKRKAELENEEKSSLAELMLDQLEIADLVLINKTDLVDKDQLKVVAGFVQGINPGSEILFSRYSEIDLSEIFKPRFNLQKAEICQRWIAQRHKEEDIPETVKYNISSFVYRARRPFDPHKFHSLITNEKYWPFWPKITRAKGFFWLANYPRFEFLVQKAGSRIFYSIEKPWYFEMPKNKWASDKKELKQFQEFIGRYWEEPLGDKRNEIVFISKDLNESEIRQTLDDCLIPESLLQKYEESYREVDDPFNYQWKDAIKFFQENDLLLQNEEQWEEIDEESEEESQFLPNQ